MEKPSSTRRPGGTGQVERRTGSLLYPGDSQLPQIVPPASGSFSRFRTEISNHGAPGGRDGSAQGVTGGSGSVTLESPSDDGTPISQTLQDRLDFSIVFGEIQANSKYNKNQGNEDEGPDIPNPSRKQQRQKSRVPGQSITIFAFRVALLEKTASGLGKIAFLWATVVILGGFASTVALTDFLVVTLIILAQTTRIFGRSHELEWQHLLSTSGGELGLSRVVGNAFRSLSATLSRTADSPHASTTGPEFKRRAISATSAPGRLGGKRSLIEKPPKYPGSHDSAPIFWPTSASDLYTIRRPWALHNVSIVPFASGLTTELVSVVLSFVQIVSAGVSIGLSFWRLSSQCFVEDNTRSGGNSECLTLANVTVSMNVFYLLAFLEAGLFLLEKAYWEYSMTFKKLLDRVCKDDHVGDKNKVLVRQFFYDVYSKSLTESVVDGLNMDLVVYSISWLQTEDFEQQLLGARLLNQVVSKDNKFRIKDPFAADALRRLGTTPGSIERLVEMLSWGSKHEEELLLEVSTIICRLVVYTRNCARFVAVPGAMDGVVSLLIDHTTNSDDQVLKRSPKNSVPPLALRLMGLRILKSLCRDPKNSQKIGETRGVLSILMVFIEVRVRKPLFQCIDVTDIAHIKTYKKSLQVLLLLASATNISGEILRKRIAAIVSSLKNLRDIIESGEKGPELQRLSIQILYYLAMEDDVRRMIGATGGVIHTLFKLFRKHKKVQDCVIEGTETPEARKMRKERKLVCEEAGQTLARLVIQNERNCVRLLELKDKRNKKSLVRVMVEALSESEKIASSAAFILRSVLKYADDSTKRAIATQTSTLIIENIFLIRPDASTKSEMYAAFLGLAARTVEKLDVKSYQEILETVNKAEFVQQLTRNLRHTPTTKRFPSIRRFTLELIIALSQKDNSFLDAFGKHSRDLRGVLENTLDATSELENFCLFSGLVGYTKYFEDIEHLINRAITAVDNYHRKSRDHELYLT